MKIHGIATVFSKDRVYRYTLQRHWTKTESDLWSDRGDTGFVQWIGLNPSTADELKNDPTVTRCIQFSKDWGYNGMVMTNLFAFRSTDPKPMLAHKEPTGEDNDFLLRYIADQAALVICAWGNHGAHMGRSKDVVERVLGEREIHCLRLTSRKEPWHPLYLPKTLTPIPFKR